MNRDEAYALLTEYTQSASLIKHALAVEAAMVHYARHFGEDEAEWGLVGLIHDFDVFFTYTDDPFAQTKTSDTDGDGDGFTPAILLDTAPLGTEGEISVDFLDDTADCITITWGPQRVEVFSQCGDPIAATFSFPE